MPERIKAGVAMGVVAAMFIFALESWFGFRLERDGFAAILLLCGTIGSALPKDSSPLSSSAPPTEKT